LLRVLGEDAATTISGSAAGLFCVLEEGAATTISVNDLGLTSGCFKSAAHNTNCINYVHRFKNMKS
jgi:hypothetical protein